MVWTPEQVTELVKVLFLGVGALSVSLATVYSIIGAARAKRAEVSSLANAVSIKALEKNTNSISERNEAIAKKLGITEGVAQERASVLAHASAPQVVMQQQPIASAQPAPGRPLPVADERTAVAAERTATATEDSAKAAERVADVAEEAAKKS